MKLFSKVATLVMSVALATTMAVGVTCGVAFADGNKVDVAITIVDNTATDNKVIYNDKVTVSEEATVADALKTAGYSEVDSIEKTAGKKSYYAMYGYPYFAGKNSVRNEAGNYVYWIDFFNNSFDSDGTKTSLNAVVASKGHYQFVYDVANFDADWNCLNTFAYTSAIPDPLAAKPAVSKAAPAKKVTSVTKSGVTYSISGKVAKVTKVKKSLKSATIAKSVKIDGKIYKVSKIAKSVFKGTKVKTVTIKSDTLAKKSVKNCFKGSKVKTVKVKVGSKKLNKKYVKKYKKIFTKKNCGKAKVTVK